MGEERLKTILRNVLIDILRYSDMDRETYIDWLKHEIGVTEEEIKLLDLPTSALD